MASIEELEKREKYVDALVDQFLGTQVEKKLLGERYVRFGPLVNTSAFLFQEGGLVGGAYATRFATFAIPFFAIRKSREAAEFTLDEARTAAVLVPNAETIIEFFLRYEMATMGPTNSRDPYQWLASRANEHVSLEAAFMFGKVSCSRGAAFGAQFPDRFTALYDNTYKPRDPAYRKLMNSFGAGVAEEQPQIVPLAERQRESIGGFLTFCADVYPELVGALQGSE